MRYILVISQQDAEKSKVFSRYGNLFPAYTGYTVRSDGHLYSSGKMFFRGGMLFITLSQKYDMRRNVDLMREITTVCRRHSSAGIVLSSQFDCSRLCEMLRRNLSCEIYSDCEKCAPPCKIIISSAISGGSLRERLASASEKYGKENISLGIEPVRCDFTLPSYGGVGKSMTLYETQEQIRRYRVRSFYSDELCENYYTYRENGNAHMVLFDNSISIKRKIALSASLGISDVFMAYPDVSEILSGIIAADPRV